MSVIFSRIFLQAGKVLTYQSIKNRPVLSKLNGNFNPLSTLVHADSNGCDKYASSVDDQLQPPQNSAQSVRERLDVEDLPDVSQNSKRSVLEELDVEDLPDVSHVTPELRPSFNFAYFANKSEVIKQLIDLGVDFHLIEKRKRVPSFLLQLDFEKDVKPYISFLFEHGVPADELGRFFTKNPFLLQESLEDLKIRINYLESKKFTREMISRIITVNPRWLSHTTQKIDTILGQFQKSLRLTGEEIRYVVCKSPQVIDIDGDKLRDDIFLFKDVIGFDMTQTKTLFLKVPYVWRQSRVVLQERLDVMLVDMEVPHSAIVAQPSGLNCRAKKLKERHLFLKELGRAQYDPTKPGYVSIDDISIGNDATFCDKVAKTSIETYNLFLKSL